MEIVITYLNLCDIDSEASDSPSSGGTRVLLSSSSNIENEFLKFYMGVSNIRVLFIYLTRQSLNTAPRYGETRNWTRFQQHDKGMHI